MDFLFIVLFVLAIGLKAYKSVAGQSDPSEAVPVPGPISDDVEENPDPDYFTYETIANNVPQAPANGHPFVAAMSEEPELSDSQAAVSNFDLRTAVIYETILHNDYISEIR